MIKGTSYNKPIAYMAADVIIQASVLRINISYYPQSSLLETATNAIAKTSVGDNAVKVRWKK